MDRALSQVLQEVEQGQEEVTALAGELIAPPGAMRGKIAMAEDFAAPLDGLFEVLQS